MPKAETSPEFCQFVRDVFSCDSDGVITQKIDRRSPRGQILSPAGVRKPSINDQGYAIITCKYGDKNLMLRQHRLVWFLTHGYWPKEIDHINGVRADNRLSNLREVTRTVNGCNRHKSFGKSAHLPVGIYETVKNGYKCFKAAFTYAGKSMSTYRTKLEDAIAWREQKMREYGIIA